MKIADTVRWSDREWIIFSRAEYGRWTLIRKGPRGPQFAIASEDELELLEGIEEAE
jgi:hypothetical protein